MVTVEQRRHPLALRGVEALLRRLPQPELSATALHAAAERSARRAGAMAAQWSLSVESAG
ncbi:MAG: hypothetical protein EP330_15740 [Deltaproteobacteria bacterium]|nr:MAG: hypothetical protein EP330_15740 [Deltaproteobacteria bacterium]